MKSMCLILALAMVLPAGAFCDDIDDIYQLIERGRWRVAVERVSGMGDVSTNGPVLFLQGLLAANADRAAHLLEAALKQGVEVKYQEEIYFRLTQYYLQKKNLSKVSTLTTEYRTRWERGKYRASMARMRILAEELGGDRTTALSLNDRYLKSFSKGDAEVWGIIDRARILLGERGEENGIRQFERLAAARSDIAVPPSVYLLGLYHAERGDEETAVRYYSLLREEYPNAVGVDLLSRQLGDRPRLVAKEGVPPDRGDEARTHVAYYTIQVGAFSTKQFAEEQVERLKRERMQTEIEKREVEGRPLWFVYMGRYKAAREAEKAREKLEKQYGESYKVIPR